MNEYDYGPIKGVRLFMETSKAETYRFVALKIGRETDAARADLTNREIIAALDAVARHFGIETPTWKYYE